MPCLPSPDTGFLLETVGEAVGQRGEQRRVEPWPGRQPGAERVEHADADTGPFGDRIDER